jgi:transposase
MIGHVCRLIGDGLHIRTATRVMGISRPTYYNWKERGEEIEKKIDNNQIKKDDLNEKDKLYLKFWQDIQIAEAQSEVTHVQIIAQAGAEKDWRASSWILQNRFPERWADKKKVELDAKVETKRSLEDIVLGNNDD